MTSLLQSTRLIDSKVEEGSYTYSSSTKFDPVLSGNVTVQYQSSQRLIEEICEMNEKRKESTKTPVSTTTTKPKKKPKPSSTTPSIMTRNDVKKVVQELCRRTNLAVLEISQQQSMYQQSNAVQSSVTMPSHTSHSFNLLLVAIDLLLLLFDC